MATMDAMNQKGPLDPVELDDLDGQVPFLVGLSADDSVGLLTVATEEFEVDGAAAVFSTWRVEEDDPLRIGDIEIDESFYFQIGQVVLDARMTDERAQGCLRASFRARFFFGLSFCALTPAGSSRISSTPFARR